MLKFVQNYVTRETKTFSRYEHKRIRQMGAGRAVRLVRLGHSEVLHVLHDARLYDRIGGLALWRLRRRHS